jgi:hypothetical protein
VRRPLETRNAKETDEETTIKGLKKYPWRMQISHVEGTMAPSEKMEETALLFEDKNMRV